MEEQKLVHKSAKKLNFWLYVLGVLAIFFSTGAISQIGKTAGVVLLVITVAFVALFVLCCLKIKAVKEYNKEVDENLAKFNINEYFISAKPFRVVDIGIIFENSIFSFENIESIKLVTAPTLIVPGVAKMISGGKEYNLNYTFSDRERAIHVLNFAIDKVGESRGEKQDYKYKIVAHTGTSLEVYENHIVINYMRTGGVISAAANILTGGGTGGKRIAISDITSIQFKEPAGVTVGFIQFSYPGSVDKQGGIGNALDDENSIPISEENLSLAKQAVNYIETQRDNLRSSKGVVVQQQSSADELKKYKELLDSGVISQEEFDAKKKQLLGI